MFDRSLLLLGAAACLALFAPPASADTLVNPLHLWTFNDGTAKDSAGNANGTLINGASIRDGKLVLDGVNDYMRTAGTSASIGAKTLMAWVSLANLTQRGGGVLTITNGSSLINSEIFDSIVFGERQVRHWENGSDFFRRTPATNTGALETSTNSEVFLSLVYNTNNSVQIYRNGQLYATTTLGTRQTFGAGSIFLLGLRVFNSRNVTGGTATGTDVFLAGSIDEARVYGAALTSTQILAAYNAGPTTTVPEPASITATGLGLLGLAAGAIRWKRTK